jgi:signal transduction histidine kinase
MGRRLFWRIYVTLLASLVLVALLGAAAWRWGGEALPRHGMEMATSIVDALLPGPEAPDETQRAALERLAHAVDGRLTLIDPNGRLIAEAGDQRMMHGRPLRLRLIFADGRRLVAQVPHPHWQPLWTALKFLAIVTIAVAIAALPAVRRITRRVERLRIAVESWGGGKLGERVKVEGRDEIAALAKSFNASAERIEALIASQRTLLANASHELRSPLTRLRMAIEMGGGDRGEIERNLAELDQLIGEILLASRLDHREHDAKREPVDLLALAAEEAARVGASAGGDMATILGDTTLLRRLLRNLFENAARHGAPPIEARLVRSDAHVRVLIEDRGRGIPESERERIFEPFYRPAGASESGGSWGLGLSLVRRIATLHNGTVRAEPREGGGTRFIVEFLTS